MAKESAVRMKLTNQIRVAVAAVLLFGTAASVSAGQPDPAVIVQFQRAADRYAFEHRQIDRRGSPIPARSEGEIFTPQVSAALRTLLQAAVRRGCETPANAGTNFVVPRVNESSDGTVPLSACLVSALPKLPPELEYRAAGIALVLADAHRHLVVDVMHGVF